MKNNVYAILISLAFVVVVQSQTNYCNFRNCNHTLCAFPNSAPSSQCANPILDGLSAAEKQRILLAHNTFRQKVASGQETRGNPGPQPAGTIPNLVWNDEIALIAQRWADQCTVQPDTCRRTAQYSWVNQNQVLQGTSADISTIKVEDLVKKWTDSVANFNKSTIPKYSPSSKSGTYSQVVWGSTTDVGCGAITYERGVYNWFYLVCNYAPGGNLQGARVYQT